MVMLPLSGVVALSCMTVTPMLLPLRLSVNCLLAAPSWSMVAVLLLLDTVWSKLIAAVWFPDPFWYMRKSLPELPCPGVVRYVPPAMPLGGVPMNAM